MTADVGWFDMKKAIPEPARYKVAMAVINYCAAHY
jgi:hypothetical protein